jgi:transposase
MRSLGSADQDAETLHALLRLTCYLDEHEPPIDYARRRSLDYRVLLPEVQWATLCREANIAAGGGTRWRTAHAALYRQLSGNPLRSLRVDGHGAATERQVDQFARALPPTLRQALDSVGQEFLNAHGICEPTTWTPDLDDLRVDLAPPSGAEEFMPARPAAAVAQQVMSTASIAAAYTAGASTYALAPRMGVSRQTVSRLLAETSTPTRRGRPRVHNIDEMRVHEMYWVQDLTIRKIAQTFGCSSSTIARRLHAYEAVSGDGAQ